jgi:iron complex transport system substrate-binding protein
MSELRIVSFLPAATEMACALGLADHLVGISHECDYPPEVIGKPVVVRSALPVDARSPREIDTAIRQRAQSGTALYVVDEPLVRQLAPTLILTQDLCGVCAPAREQMNRAIAGLETNPKLLSFSPKSLAEVDNNLRQLGRSTGRLSQAEELVANQRRRLSKVTELIRGAAHCPRVLCLEWMDPFYTSGHWVPEMVQLAGGVDGLTQGGAESRRPTAEEINAFDPEVLVVMPCGFSVEHAFAQAQSFVASKVCAEITAVRQNRVFAVDARS